jgi:hypothetical protein
MRHKGEQLHIYTIAENRQWLEQRVDDLNCSMSEYVHELIQRHIDLLREHHDYEYDPSERLDTIAEGVYDETELLLQKYGDESSTIPLHQPGGFHLAVLWKLLADEYSDADRQFAMELARDDVRERVDSSLETPVIAERWRDRTRIEPTDDQLTNETVSAPDRTGDSNE